MIASLFIYIIGLLAYAISSVLGVITNIIPAQFLTSIEFFTSYLRYANGFVNIAGIMAPTIWFTAFMSGWFSFKLVVWVWHAVFHGAANTQQLPTQNKK